MCTSSHLLVPYIKHTDKQMHNNYVGTVTLVCMFANG